MAFSGLSISDESRCLRVVGIVDFVLFVLVLLRSKIRDNFLNPFFSLKRSSLLYPLSVYMGHHHFHLIVQNSYATKASPRSNSKNWIYALQNRLLRQPDGHHVNPW